jgi:hypothetical protein
MRTESGGYRRDHLRALAQRVEVDAKEVRIIERASAYEMARRKRFELAIMPNIISLSFNIPRDGGEVERHRARSQHPQLATALHLLEFTEAKDRLLQISESDHFRTRLPQ